MAQSALSIVCVSSQVSSWWIAVSAHWPFLIPLVAVAYWLGCHFFFAEVGKLILEHTWAFIKPLAIMTMHKISHLTSLDFSSIYLAES